ncbi:uncharacterized protein LOC127808239 isoform X2 [Diospyros lotus]|uniref:uncharacterized protein LOC127808239 isoform X2 n=1 Tax=Diospyros lotus TaxID=55363 RepID=UPI002252D8FE|nr:uncharacterized protein LOC127808239 isoform X2 [Diospyros lotus]
MVEGMQSSVNGGLPQLQSCGESSEEELAVLPRHTKVVVTGNNRTKSVLVGLHGVVKKAVGLGGWHWLVLANGVEVKLQRNALSVIEAPSGNEEDEDLECENGHRNASDMASDDSQKSQRTRHRMHKSCGSSRLPASSSSSRDSLSKKSYLSVLETPALWRYCQHYNLAGNLTNSTREQLLEAAEKHFRAMKTNGWVISSDFFWW